MYAPQDDPLALAFDLGEHYSPPQDPLAQNFDLVESVPFVYRKPPLAVSCSHGSEATSARFRESRRAYYAEGIALSVETSPQASEQAWPVPQIGRASPWDAVPPRDSAFQPYSSSEATSLALASKRSDWGSTTPADAGRPHMWDDKVPRDRGFVQQFGDPKDHNVTELQPSSDAILNWQPPAGSIGADLASETLNLDSGPYVPPQPAIVHFELKRLTLSPPTRSVDSGNYIPAWSLKDALDGATIHSWDRKPRIGTEIIFTADIEPNSPVDLPPVEPVIQQSYLFMNSSSLIEVDSSTPLDFQDLTVGLDLDSFAWVMTCRLLNRASMDLIRPTAAGPAEVDLTINGWQWRLLVESYGRDKSFPKETYRIKAVSRHQLLAAPYAPKRTGRLASATNVLQIMANQLQYTGFFVTPQAGLTDYSVPAGAWGYENKTAMEVIAELAAAQGAVPVPDRVNDEIHIKHRYKGVGPWNYAAQEIAFVDAVVQDSVVTSESSQWEPQPQVDSVFVSGISSGVAVTVIRTGFPGSDPAPDILDDLNVDSSQCRERGLAEIAASGNQEIVTLEAPLPSSGAPGLIEPGMILELRHTLEPAADWRGNVLGVSISVARPGASQVKQTAKVERHHY